MTSPKPFNEITKLEHLIGDLKMVEDCLFHGNDDQQKDAVIIDKAIDILQMIYSWTTAYPEDIFIPMTKEDWVDHHEILKLSKRSGSAAAADCMRYVVTRMKEAMEERA